MSRFFASNSISSDEESDHDTGLVGSRDQNKQSFGMFHSVSDTDSDFSSSGSEDDSEPEVEVGEENAAPVRKSCFVFDSDSDSDDDSGHGARQVKSHRERLISEMNTISQSLQDAVSCLIPNNLHDATDDGLMAEEEGSVDAVPWITVEADFDRLMRTIKKSQGKAKIPSFTVLCFPTLEKALTTAAAQSSRVKAMSTTVAKAFNAMRRKVRKVCIEYESLIADATSAPMSDSEAGSDSEGESLKNDSAHEVATVPSELSRENVMRRLQEILASRGRKHADKTENLSTLRKMLTLTVDNDRRTMHVLVALVSCGFELANQPSTQTSSSGGCFPIEAWLTIIGDLERLLSIISSPGSLETLNNRLGFSFKLPDGVLGAAKKDIITDEERTPEEEEFSLPTLNVIRGTLISYTQRIDDEFTRSLQACDPQSSDYGEYLRWEPRLFALIIGCLACVFSETGKLSDVSEKTGKKNFIDSQTSEFSSQLVLRLLDRVYAKDISVAQRFFMGADVASLCKFLYKQEVSERYSTRALLSHVYWLAMHGDFLRAMNLFMQSRVQDVLGHLDVPTQILHNRAIVQLGLAAFRAGYLREAYLSLQEIVGSGRPKELLAQGIIGQRYSSAQGGVSMASEAAQEKIERQRLVPFHMHINVEVVDAVFIICSLLLETTQNAASSRRFFQGDRRQFGSRHLRRLLDSYEKCLFNGPPENARERLVMAAVSLINGRWHECESLIMKTDVLFEQEISKEGVENIKEMLRMRIREAAYVTYLYGMAPALCRSMSLADLSAQFDLPIEKVTSCLKMLATNHGLPLQITDDSKFAVWTSEDVLDYDNPVQEALAVLAEKTVLLKERCADAADCLSTLTNLQTRISRTNATSPPSKQLPLAAA